MSNAKRVTGLLTLALLTVVGIWGFIAWRNAPPIEHVSTPDPLDKLGFSATTGAVPGYLPDEACASCHAELYASYQDVGMARSFTRPRPENLIEDFENNQFYHAPSQRHYEMTFRDGTLFFKRYQRDENGEPINVYEQAVDWIVGSGNKTRSYLYQNEAGELYQLPIGWYTEARQWGMGPGYDIKDHLGVQRAIRRECLFCHNAFPEVPEGNDLRSQTPTFPDDLPEGTGCQRCHGPGAEHARTVLRGGASLEQIRAAIVNPARLAPERRDAVCFQCHLLPAVSLIGVRRFDRPDYSFRPGQALSDYLVHVDPDEAGMPRSERFEINHHAYRLRQSACFEQSAGALTCITCHDPHRKVPKAERIAHYSAACLNCHEPHAAPPSPTTVASDDCMACHMPQRRTQDVVQVVMTDHKIGRYTVGPYLTAPLDEGGAPTLEGVAFLDPETAPAGALGDVYLATAVVRAYPNARGVEQLGKTLARARPNAIVPYYDLARGQLKLRQYAQAEQTVRYLLEQQPDDPALLEWLSIARNGQGASDEAIALLREVLRRHPNRTDTHFNLGLFLSVQGEDDEALQHFQQAVTMRPTLVAAWYYMGTVTARLGRTDEAIDHYRRALAIDPTHSRSYAAIGRVFMRNGAQTEAQRYWSHGLKVATQPGVIATALVDAADADTLPPEIP